MKLQEYRSKEILARHGVPVSAGETATRPEEARAAAARIGGPVVIKAQVLVGGRGKAGGVKLAANPDEAAARAAEIIGLVIKGVTVRTVLVAPAAPIAKEYYLGLILDRAGQAVTIIASADGGVEIEETARTNPAAILRLPLHPLIGLQEHQVRRVGFFLGLPAELRKDFAAILRGLYAAFMESDADLAEINPLVVTERGAGCWRSTPRSCSTTRPSSATRSWRRCATWARRSRRRPPRATPGINFIKLDGSIGCMVNGAGLAMTTMDLVKLAGGEPANFLDIGGGAKADRVAAALRHHPGRPERAGHPDQHLRRHHPRRRGGTRHRGGARLARAHRADGRPHRRHERGRGPRDPAGREPDHRRQPGRCGAQGRGGRRRLRVSILVGRETRLLVQGITGREGEFHSRAMLEYGTSIVAGVTPGKGGQSAVEGQCRSSTRSPTRWPRPVPTPPASSCRPPFAPDAMLEAADAGLALVICITEGIPALDMLRVHHVLRARGVRLIGPNCPGLTTVGEAKVGIIPGDIHRPGPVGLVSRSGTLTYEVVQAMTDAGVGQTTCVGIGGDPIVGTSFIDVLELLNADPQTEAIVLIGEIGGDEEERAAAYCAREVRKPVAAFIAGPDRAARTPDGARGGDHLGRRRHRRVEASGAHRGRRSSSRTPLRRSPPCCARPGFASRPAAASHSSRRIAISTLSVSRPSTRNERRMTPSRWKPTFS